MKTYVILQNFNSKDCKKIIVRNLNRILDIRIVDLNEKSGSITFLHQSENVFNKVKQELKNIGYPIKPDTKKVAEIDTVPSIIGRPPCQATKND